MSLCDRCDPSVHSAKRRGNGVIFPPQLERVWRHWVSIKTTKGKRPPTRTALDPKRSFSSASSKLQYQRSVFATEFCTENAPIFQSLGFAAKLLINAEPTGSRLLILALGRARPPTFFITNMTERLYDDLEN
jgi:hypothetical protein